MNSRIIKSMPEQAIMREAGEILAEIVRLLSIEVVEGNSVLEVDKYAEFLCKRFDVRPAFKGYGGFKGTICANLNEVVVHGAPATVNRKFTNGDIFGLDMGVVHKGFNSDMSTTIIIGQTTKEIKEFLNKTYESMMAGINAAIVGNTVGDISFAMRNGFLSDTFSLMRDFIGHGIGKELHESPEIPALGLKPGEGMKLQPGMALAIESISVMGPSNDYEIDKDNWTVYTKERRYLSGLYEHTILVTESGPEIVTIKH